ncbi:conserved hypothetical protein [Paenibacillus curdlanolyticus YK9]|uniref:Uncharacterized protein n=1 Tax=Paenibacillus curdlanolyticus YK9 TaxID=717606 RepID=E0IGG1_9BACL|nr:hypothetical protein [Paenibacillus curdlanolyticus]EFM08461.1 conserved hypothetical protein [Paenibacillus curdlanolyticus YK9]
MGMLIDARTSMNINSPLPTPTLYPMDKPVLIGQVGLNVPSDTTGIIRVLFDGIVGITLPEQPIKLLQVTLFIVKGSQVSDPILYQSVQTYSAGDMGIQLIPLAASDYNVPAPSDGVLVYTLYASVDLDTIWRAGPESFNASAYTG